MGFALYKITYILTIAAPCTAGATRHDLLFAHVLLVLTPHAKVGPGAG